MSQEPALVQISSETVAPRQVKLTILVPTERRARTRHAVAQELGKRERVRGFRPGHIPPEKVEAIVGGEAFQGAFLQRIGPEVLQEAIKEAGLEPSAPVRLGIVTEEPLVFQAIVPLQPEVTLGDYRALRVPSPAIEGVGEADVDAVIDSLRGEMAILTPLDGPAESGDIAEVAVVGTLESETVVDETFRFPLDPAQLPERTVPPGAVDALIGAWVGETRNVEVAYSEFWPDARLQGRRVALSATIRSLARRELPEPDDVFAAQAAQGATLAELRERIRSRMTADRSDAARDAHAQAAVAALIGQAHIEYPPLLLEYEVLEILDDLRADVERAGLDWDAWIASQRENEERLLESIERQAKLRLERSLVLQRFALAEGIRIDPADLDRVVKTAIRSLPEGSRKKLKPTAEQRARLGNQMMLAHVIDRLLAVMSPEQERAQP